MDRSARDPIVFRGKVYGRPDDMPAADRQAYEQALRTLGEAIPSGAPDAWEEWELDRRLLSPRGQPSSPSPCHKEVR